ncbi:MAG: hypothetical protein HDR28_09900 [Lachnospiraceae bacterium]|nr:hypothetical protein [Lachnospiraceae bacterium]
MKSLKIRKKYKTRIINAMILSVTFLFVGCGTDIERQEQTVPNVESEKSATDNLANMDNVAENYETLNSDDITENHETLNTDDITENHETLNTDDITESHETLNTDDITKSYETTDDIYNHVLEEYRDMVRNDFYTDLLDSDTYDSSFGEHIGLEIRTHKKAVFYAFYDIDGNGTKELIIAGGEDGIGVANPAFSPCNYDIYGYDGNNVFHLFPEMEFGYRTNFALYENGIIEVYYSCSAAESGVDFYKIGSDGLTPELVDSFSAVWHLEGEEPVCIYYQKESEVTEEEYRANMQSYAVALTAGLDWIEIY